LPHPGLRESSPSRARFAQVSGRSYFSRRPLVCLVWLSGVTSSYAGTETPKLRMSQESLEQCIERCDSGYDACIRRCPFLRGKQGVGKTKVGEVFASLLGVHFKQVSDPRYVTRPLQLAHDLAADAARGRRLLGRRQEGRRQAQGSRHRQVRTQSSSRARRRSGSTTTCGCS